MNASQRIVLRELRPDDAQTMFAYRSAGEALRALLVFAMLPRKWLERARVSPGS